jgi:hypothetical protein
MATVTTDPYTARPSEPVDPTWDPNCPGCRSGVDPTWDPNCPGCLSGIGPSDPNDPIKYEEDVARTA